MPTLAPALAFRAKTFERPIHRTPHTSVTLMHLLFLLAGTLPANRLALLGRLKLNDLDLLRLIMRIP